MFPPGPIRFGVVWTSFGSTARVLPGFDSLCLVHSNSNQELWEEERALGKRPAAWPPSKAVKCPAGFPGSSFGDALSAWACLQLFGTLMHLDRFVSYI